MLPDTGERYLSTPLFEDVAVEMTEEELEKSGLPPPFWAFAWAGGQALARYILDNPSVVSGKSVHDTFARRVALILRTFDSTTRVDCVEQDDL